MLETPGVLLSLLLASTYAAAFYAWKGQSLRDLVRYGLASGVGFAAGQALGAALHLVPLTLGVVHVLEATVGALLCLALAHWLRRS
jgi:hypothetical protein